MRQPPSPDSVLRKPGEPPRSRSSDRNDALPNPCLSPRRSPCPLSRVCWFVFTAPFESKSQCGRLPLSSLGCLSWAEDSLRNGSVTTRPWPVTSTHAARGPDVACGLWAQPGLPRVLVCPPPPSCPRPAPRALGAFSDSVSVSAPPSPGRVLPSLESLLEGPSAGHLAVSGFLHLRSDAFRLQYWVAVFLPPPQETPAVTCRVVTGCPGDAVITSQVALSRHRR